MYCIQKHATVWFAALVGGVVLVASWASADPPAASNASKIPLLKRALKTTKALPGVQTALSAIEALDEVTRRDYAAVSKVVELGFEGRTKIVTGTIKTQVQADQPQGCFRGDIRVRIQVPAEATVALDLDSLWDNMYFNPSTKTIEVSLPPLKIIAVEAQLHKATVFAEYSGWCRFAFWDYGAANELERTLLKTTDWSQRVRDEVNPNADHLRAAAAHEVRTLLRRIVEPTNPGIKIEVRP
jgi:hypothetical protein